MADIRSQINQIRSAKLNEAKERNKSYKLKPKEFQMKKVMMEKMQSEDDIV
jgi:hypothetical protein